MADTESLEAQLILILLSLKNASIAARSLLETITQFLKYGPDLTETQASAFMDMLASLQREKHLLEQEFERLRDIIATKQP